MSLFKALTGRLDPIYYKDDPIWDFLAPDHRPGGKRPVHDDWPFPFNRIQRTYTSYLFEEVYVVEGATTNKFFYEGFEYARAWANPGESYRAKVQFFDPVNKVRHVEDYSCQALTPNYSMRQGARVDDSTRDGVVFPYVNFIPGLGFLTFAIKKIE